jgi:ferredoxin, 2Fe-2S
MPNIIFIEHDGTRHQVAADVGQSVMQAAIAHSVPGILADCGGSCVCCTCLGYVQDPWSSALPPPEEAERELAATAPHPSPHGRLTCQITVTEDLEGFVVHLPVSQL